MGPYVFEPKVLGIYIYIQVKQTYELNLYILVER
jgi:hypothetical protein